MYVADEPEVSESVEDDPEGTELTVVGDSRSISVRVFLMFKWAATKPALKANFVGVWPGVWFCIFSVQQRQQPGF